MMTIAHAVRLSSGYGLRPIAQPHWGAAATASAPGQPLDPKQPASTPKRTRRPLWQWLTLWAGLLAALPVTANFGPAKVSAVLRQNAHTENPEATAKRREQIIQHVQETYLQGKAPLNWYQFAEVVDHIAKVNDNDEDFRRDLWALFGQRGKLAKQLDAANTGLPPQLMNTGYKQEQFHHYLGGTTGATHWTLPTHLLNCPAGAYLHEGREYLSDSRPDHPFNHGDVALFSVCRPHRDDFLAKGRYSVAPNIRAMLLPQPEASIAD